MGNSGIGVPLPELAAYCREAAAEGAVLLKNEGHMLPVKKDETVSIFGRSQIEYYRSGRYLRWTCVNGRGRAVDHGG